MLCNAADTLESISSACYWTICRHERSNASLCSIRAAASYSLPASYPSGPDVVLQLRVSESVIVKSWSKQLSSNSMRCGLPC